MNKVGAAGMFLRSEGQQLDFTSGVIDLSDMFNTGVAPVVNKLLVDTGAEDPILESLQDNAEEARTRGVESRKFLAEPAQKSTGSTFGFEAPTQTPESTPSDPSNFDQNFEQDFSLGDESEPTQVTNGNFKVFSGSRDQIENFSSTRGDRKIALDFNDAGNKSARGIEIVLPRDASESEIAKARAWVKETHAFYKRNGIDVPIRRGDGIKIGGGKKGVIHTEPFFAANAKARNLIQSKGSEYADILSRTLGGIEGATFIAPHERRGQGANSGSFSERSFALQNILPELSKLSGGGSRNSSSGGKVLTAQVTRYGFEGDKYQRHDATSKGSKHEDIGNRNNKLVDDVSIALPPKTAKALGVDPKAGDIVQAKINGKWETFRVDDTAGDHNNHRIDFFDPNGKRIKIDGSKVQIRKA